MPGYEVAPDVLQVLHRFVVPEHLGFGDVHAPVMFSADYTAGTWGRGKLIPYGPIEILPGARALQYAELVFEGLKAYRVGAANPSLFRPRENWLRLARSAQRLSMPAVPEVLFFEAIDAVAGTCRDIIPRQSGRALYLRPCLFGTEAGYLLRNSSCFRFMVIANPVEVYASGPMRVAIERDDVRAAAGGVGAVIDGELHTPALDGAILPGITRDSLLTLGPHLGFKVHERRMPLDEMLAQIRSGECSEVFACGTGAIVSPIAMLADRDRQEYIPQRIDAVAARYTPAPAETAVRTPSSSFPRNWPHPAFRFPPPDCSRRAPHKNRCCRT